MTLRPKVITGPAVEPVSLTEAKLHAKIDGSTENSLIEDIYIPAAREYFEDHACYTIHQQTLEITLDAFPPDGYIDLPRATPLVSVTSVIYYDDDDTPTTWDSAEYRADTDSLPGRIFLPSNGGWPSTSLRRFGGVRIRYVAGIVDSPATDAPGAIKLPILMLVAGMYENRDSETFTDMASIDAIAMRYGVEAFIARIRDRVAPASY